MINHHLQPDGIQIAINSTGIRRILDRLYSPLCIVHRGDKKACSFIFVNEEFLKITGTDHSSGTVHETGPLLFDSNPVLKERLDWISSKSPVMESEMEIYLNGYRYTMEVRMGYIEESVYYILLNNRSHILQLRKERDLFFDVSLDMVCTATFDGYFRQINPMWSIMLGWSEEELKSRPYLDFVHPDDCEETRREFATLEEGGMIVSFDNRYLCKEGGFLWLSWNCNADMQEKVIYAIAHNIQKRKEMEEALRESMIRLERAVESTHAVIWEWDITNGIIHLSPDSIRLLQLDAFSEHISITDWEKYMHPADVETFRQCVGRHMRGQSDSFQCEFRMTKPDGTWRWVLGSGKISALKDRAPSRITGTFIDITERKQWQYELLRLSTTDPLTGAFNRLKMMEMLDKETERFSRYGDVFSLIMFDIDHFKMVNDTYGHDRGDLILVMVKKVVDLVKRTTDTFSRWGGEEFLLLCPGTDISGAEQVARRLLTEIAQEDTGIEPSVTVSIGVVEYSNPEEEIRSLLKRVDVAMYKAKQAGRNTVVAE
ncbi:MAG: sensor domain-containing diguanylate cyclase [Spirochaetota bacterium]